MVFQRKRITGIPTVVFVAHDEIDLILPHAILCIQLVYSVVQLADPKHVVFITAIDGIEISHFKRTHVDSNDHAVKTAF